MATKEELQAQFDKAYTHLMKQGERSISDDGNCLYRGRNGLQCAAGACIPDELYSKDMENKYWSDVLKMRPELEEFLDENLGEELQGIHDGYHPYEWMAMLSKVASEFGLTVPTIEADQG